MPGIDIEYVDRVDGRHKYAQVIAAPAAFTYADVEAVKNAFAVIKRKERNDRLKNFFLSDCLAVVPWAEKPSNALRRLAEDHPVLIGADFWMRLTGEDAYAVIVESAREAARVSGF